MAAQPAELGGAAPQRTLPARRLRPSERVGLAAEIVTAFLQARRELRRAQIATVVQQLRSGAPAAAREIDPVTLVEARRLGRAVELTLRLVPGDTRCLARSLVLTRLLADRRIPATLVIGARPGPSFLAHAWVECAGEPILTPGDGSFGRLVEL
jgi:hypothetical protein